MFYRYLDPKTTTQIGEGDKLCLLITALPFGKKVQPNHELGLGLMIIIQ
tara:strand:+ start:192 stop:338 length:147 start_codon:yes stop_codon:yes gene_type:complete